MIVEAPKYGASSRAAEISAPRLAAPTTNAITRTYAWAVLVAVTSWDIAVLLEDSELSGMPLPATAGDHPLANSAE